MKKRFLLVMLLLCVLAGVLVSPALAAPPSNDPYALADALHEFGLFNGTGITANGSPEYSLERAPTRQETLVMLIRLLGVESDALATTATHPFTDVDSWAEKYVAYAYDIGLTKGTGATTFGGQALADAQQYVTFLLRALGYDDTKGDFAWNTALSFSDSIGLTNGSYALGDDFLRGDMVWLSCGAMLQPTKSGQALVKKLHHDGAMSDAQYQSGLTAMMMSQLREQFSSITVDGFPGTWTVNVADLYAEPGTGANEGYLRLRNYGRDTEYPIYFKGNSGLFTYNVDNTKNLDDICTWIYQGHTYKNTRRDCYTFFSDTSYFSSHFALDGETLSNEWFFETFGQIYTDWFEYQGFTNGSAERLIKRYLEYQEGSTYYEPREGLNPELYFNLFDFQETWAKQELSSDWINDTTLSQLAGKDIAFGVMSSSLPGYSLGTGKPVYGFFVEGIVSRELLFLYDMPESFFQGPDAEGIYGGIHFKKADGEIYFNPTDLITVGLLKADGSFNADFQPQTFDSSKAQLSLKWVNEDQMDALYGLSSFWAGEEVWITRNSDNTRFVITGSPASKMNPGVTYTGTWNNKSIRFQYDNGLVFFFDDLISAGIITASF